MLRPLSHSGASDRTQTSAGCPLGICDGSGWLLDDSNNARPCDCRETQISRALARRMGARIPKRYRGVSFERRPICDLDSLSVLRPVRDFVRRIDHNLDAGRGLWFHGDTGTGKTSLAMLVSKAALDADRSVAIYSVPSLLAEIKDTYDRDSELSYMRFFRQLCAVDLLVLDDLGAEKQTEWVLEQLYSIVNERWQNEASILVTTNTPSPDRDTPARELRREVDELRRGRERGAQAEQLREIAARLERTANKLAELESQPDIDLLAWIRQRIGPRTVSRLVEICDDPIPMMGPDLRMTAGQP